MTRNLLIRLFTVTVVLSAMSTVSAQNPKLVINELMQSNVDLIMDDLNEFPDSWVEVYNAGRETVDLANYKIGITPDPNDAWPLPKMTIPSGGHQIIYCDKEADDLHTHFRLDSGKDCEVYFFSGDTLVDYIGGMGKQPAPNIAYGRQTDGADIWGYQLLPTPGESNIGQICDRDHILGEPIFSEPGSVRTDARTIVLELSMPEGSPEGAAIYYTTNGEEPSTNSRKYTSPIRISSTSVIRAKLICNGWLSPRSTTHSYIQFPRDLTLPVISIVTDDNYFNNDWVGIFPNNEGDNLNNHHNWRRPVNIEYFEGVDTSSIINQLGETRVGGGRSREFSRKTLMIYANKRFGTKRFSHEFFPDQKPGLTEFKSLALRNAGNDFNSLYMRDAIVQRHMGTHTDIDWQAWRPAIVYINGEYYSMLNIRERGNEDNVYTNYDGLEDIDLFENWNDLKEGDDKNLNRFKNFYNQAGHTMAEYEKWMDCEEYANYMILSLYHNNLDFPGNNTILWRPRTDDGRWRWIAKDVDYSLGLYNIPYNYKIFWWFYNPNYDDYWSWGANDSEYTMLFRQLMEIDEFKNMFIEHCAIYMGDFLNEAGIHKVWDPMYEQIKYEYPYHRALISKNPDYQKEMEHVNDWLKYRTDEFYKQIGSYYKVGNPIPLTINNGQIENPLEEVLINNISLSEKRFNGKFYPDFNINIEAKAIKGRELIGWWIQETSGTSTTSKEYMGQQLSFKMPEKCDKLVIEPICYNVLANGILDVTRTDQHPNAVYDMNGRIVRQGSTSLEGLPQGIYIVGGKKVVK